jgi:ABC-type lipoprotein release transport system permease subunit
MALGAERVTVLRDPATIAGVAALITAVAAAASLIPAVRATRVDPIVVIREE